MTHFESPAFVQSFLDNLAPDEPFTVVFCKVDSDEQRRYTGTLAPNGTRRDLVNFQSIGDGWKAFRIDRVLWIGRP
jgi:hypothetical protein